MWLNTPDRAGPHCWAPGWRHRVVGTGRALGRPLRAASTAAVSPPACGRGRGIGSSHYARARLKTRVTPPRLSAACSDPPPRPVALRWSPGLRGPRVENLGHVPVQPHGGQPGPGPRCPQRPLSFPVTSARPEALAGPLPPGASPVLAGRSLRPGRGSVHEGFSGSRSDLWCPFVLIPFGTGHATERPPEVVASASRPPDRFLSPRLHGLLRPSSPHCSLWGAHKAWGRVQHLSQKVAAARAAFPPAEHAVALECIPPGSVRLDVVFVPRRRVGSSSWDAGRTGAYEVRSREPSAPLGKRGHRAFPCRRLSHSFRFRAKRTRVHVRVPAPGVPAVALPSRAPGLQPKPHRGRARETPAGKLTPCPPEGTEGDGG